MDNRSGYRVDKLTQSLASVTDQNPVFMNAPAIGQGILPGSEFEGLTFACFLSIHINPTSLLNKGKFFDSIIYSMWVFQVLL